MPPIPEWAGGATGWVAAVAGFLLLVAFFWKFLSPVIKKGRELDKKFEGFLKDWNGIPEQRDLSDNVTQEGVPGVAARILALEKYTEQIHHEVTPNHGGSMKDAMKRTEDAIAQLQAKADDTKDKLREHILIAKEADEEQKRLVQDVGKLKSKYAPED